ncbi:MAG: glucose-1-phosphate cytidylyltransferase [Planctomycetes bacterium]|nr:glucose-1-phosphate cytidylyltransferase [Planctomycetota bacterium]
MKTVILCGGLGTRLSEETQIKPKPMVEIGGHPILWHVMNIYSHYGHKDFVLALGYKGEVIKQYFVDYNLMTNDVTAYLGKGKVEYTNNGAEDWTVSMMDTGKNSLTGGRLHRLKDMLRPTGRFMLTYGDGVSDINVSELIKFHEKSGKIATVTAVRPPARFGGMEIDADAVIDFKEKPQIGEGWINGGFFVFEPEIFDYLHGDMTVLEGDPMENLVKDGQLAAYRHTGFWQCMDTLRDKNSLEAMWADGNAAWKL